MTDDFFVRIRKASINEFEFVVEEEKLKKGFRKQYRYMMDRDTYAEQLEKCGYDYDRLLGKLRLTESKQMIFDYA